MKRKQPKQRKLRKCEQCAGGNEKPWPLRDVVAKLVEASDILLDDRNYDGHGYEQINAARDAARSWLAQ